MKIRYRAADLILAVSVLVVVSAIYYLGNFWLYGGGGKGFAGRKRLLYNIVILYRQSFHSLLVFQEIQC